MICGALEKHLLTYLGYLPCRTKQATSNPRREGLPHSRLRRRVNENDDLCRGKEMSPISVLKPSPYIVFL